MTRARLIEKVISRWFEALNWIDIDGESPRLTASITVHNEDGSWTHEEFNLLDMADAIDLELDRIIRETAR